MILAKTGIDVLLGEHLDGERLVAAFQTALEWKFHRFGVVVAEDDVLGFDVLDIFLLFLALLDVAVLVAVFGDGMPPEFAAAAGFLADLQFDAFFLFVLG